MSIQIALVWRVRLAERGEHRPILPVVTGGIDRRPSQAAPGPYPHPPGGDPRRHDHGTRGRRRPRRRCVQLRPTRCSGTPICRSPVRTASRMPGSTAGRSTPLPCPAAPSAASVGRRTRRDRVGGQPACRRTRDRSGRDASSQRPRRRRRRHHPDRHARGGEHARSHHGVLPAGRTRRGTPRPEPFSPIASLPSATTSLRKGTGSPPGSRTSASRSVFPNAAS